MRELRNARDGERIRSRGLSRPGWREIAGTLRSVAGWPSGREWNGLQPGQGATELGFPRPAPGEMQSEAARRAGDPSHQSEDPPPEGLGGHDLLTQADANAVQRARLCADHLDQPRLGRRWRRSAPTACWFSPTPWLEVASMAILRPRRGGDDRVPPVPASPHRGR